MALADGAWRMLAGKPKYIPIMVSLPDPSGIAQELNGLALQRVKEFSDTAKYNTASLILGLKPIIERGGVKDAKAQAVDQLGLTNSSDSRDQAAIKQVEQNIDNHPEYHEIHAWKHCALKCKLQHPTTVKLRE
jgi:hypothetical protein